MNELSDHSKIVTFFKEGLATQDMDEIDNYKWRKRGILYKWDKGKESIFRNKLCNSLKEIEEINQLLDAGLVHTRGNKPNSYILVLLKPLSKKSQKRF